MTAKPAHKFSRDVAWNVVSLGVAGVCGILLNYLISVVYSPAALGVFNQVFAAYILFSQVAALGIHYSALQRIAAGDEPGERAAVATSALALTAVLAVAVAAAFWAVAPIAGDLLDSDDVVTGMAFAAPGVFFFALNKVLLGCLNGVRRMRWYAILGAGRFALMLGAFAVAAAAGADRAALPILLTVAEAGTAVVAVIASRDLFGRLGLAELRRRAADHLAFGVKGVMSGVLAEVNSRVDVLMLGYFASDTVVGVYSFAAIFAEGMFQLLIVLRTNYAPIVARLIATDEREELLAIVHRGRNRTYALSLVGGALAVAGYVILIPLVTTDPVLAESWHYFAVLIAGMVSCAGYVPFNQILLHARLPGWHSLFMLAVIGINIGANLALIPVLGALGAAIATAGAFAASGTLIAVLARRLLGLAI